MSKRKKPIKIDDELDLKISYECPICLEDHQEDIKINNESSSVKLKNTCHSISLSMREIPLTKEEKKQVEKEMREAFYVSLKELRGESI